MLAVKICASNLVSFKVKLSKLIEETSFYVIFPATLLLFEFLIDKVAFY
jgi:hypothetical protein